MQNLSHFLHDLQDNSPGLAARPQSTNLASNATAPSAPPEYTCDRCRDDGIAGWKTPWTYPLHQVTFCTCPEGQAVQAFWHKKDAANRMKRLSELFDRAGVPLHFRDFTLESLLALAGRDPAKRAAFDAAVQLIEHGFIHQRGQHRRGLILFGPYGAGKTGLLTPILRHWIDQGRAGLWIEFYDFTDAIQSGYNTGASLQALEAAQQSDWLLLDDLGDLGRADRTTGFAETTDKCRILYQLINYRHNHLLPTLVSTNLTPPQLAEQFGDRTMERLLESCAIVQMAGANLRQKG